MKCKIDGSTVNAKVSENLGYQGGAYRKVVEYQGREYIVTKYGSEWRRTDPMSKLGIPPNSTGNDDLKGG